MEKRLGFEAWAAFLLTMFGLLALGGGAGVSASVIILIGMVSGLHWLIYNVRSTKTSGEKKQIIIKFILASIIIFIILVWVLAG